MEVGPGVFRVPGVRGSNVYVVRGERAALIDTGLPGNAHVVVVFLRTLGLAPHDLAAVLVTHWHRDHTGSLRALRVATGAPVLAHPADALLLPDASAGLFNRTRRAARVLAGWPVADGALAEAQTFPEFRGLTVWHTPGHTPGSVCFWLPESGVLFTGDTVLSNRDRLSRPLPGPGTDRAELERSLARLAALEPQVVAAGHGVLVTDGAADLLRRLAARPPDPLVLRVVRNWRRLLHFSRELHRRS